MTPEELIARAKDLEINSNHFSGSMGKLQAIYEYKRLVSDMVKCIVDLQVEIVLLQPDEVILAEFEKLPGGVEAHVEQMRELIRKGVEKANQERKQP